LKVDRSGGPDACWPWLGSKLKSGGYGRYRPSKAIEHRAHVYAFKNAVGPVPKGMVLLHSCDNPPCCNPKHLSAGTHGDNMADKVAKGRQLKGSQFSSAKLTEADVLSIRRRPYYRQADLAREYGVHPSIISEIQGGKRWKHVKKGGEK